MMRFHSGNSRVVWGSFPYMLKLACSSLHDNIECGDWSTKLGARLILWTFRAGKELDEAVEFCKKNGIEFYAVNKNYPEEIFDETVSRKIDADIYIDDKNVGGFPGWSGAIGVGGAVPALIIYSTWKAWHEVWYWITIAALAALQVPLMIFSQPLIATYKFSFLYLFAFADYLVVAVIMQCVALLFSKVYARDRG